MAFTHTRCRATCAPFTQVLKESTPASSARRIAAQSSTVGKGRVVEANKARPAAHAAIVSAVRSRFMASNGCAERRARCRLGLALYAPRVRSSEVLDRITRPS